MRKEASFDDHWGSGWPDPELIDHCLVDPQGRAEWFAKGRDGGCFVAEGLSGAEGLSPHQGLVTATLYMNASPDHGVTLQYSRWDEKVGKLRTFHSRGDLRRLKEFVRSFHDTPLSLGLFVSFEAGCRAVKEFMKTEGELPQGIDWIAGDELPPRTFPLPHALP